MAIQFESTDPAVTVLPSVVQGVVPKLTERVATWETPGISGYGAQRLGQGGAPFQLRVIRYNTNDSTDAWIDTMTSLQGAVVTYTDDLDNEFPNMLIQRARLVSRRGVIEAGVAKVRTEMAVSGVRVA